MRGIGTLPNAAPYSNLQSFTIEGQVDSFTPAAGSHTGIFEVDSSLSVVIWAGTHLVALNFGCDDAPSLPLAGITAFRFRARRDGAAGVCTMQLWDEKTGAYLLDSKSLPVAGVLNRGGWRYSIGSFYEALGPTLHLGTLRWYSSAGPVDNNPPRRVIASGYGDLLDFEFESDFADRSGKTVPYAWYAGTASYTPALNLPPVARVDTIPVTVPAGVATPLAGSGFANTDDAALSYQWTKIAGPSGTLSGTTTNAPLFTPSSFGTYSLTLTVIDSANQSGVKPFNVGAVRIDAAGAVQDVPQAIANITGPMIMYGRNPFGWQDDRAKYMADVNGRSIETLFPQPWNTPAQGTIVCANGSDSCTGTGTRFLTDVCGPSGPLYLVLWYPSPDYSTPGRALYQVGSCSDDTHLKLARAYAHTTGTTPSMPYAVVDRESPAMVNLFGVSQITTVNYYDNVLAYYILYYRTGLDQYRQYARRLQEIVWQSPVFDRGYAVSDAVIFGSVWPWGPENRKFSLLGHMIRALDDKPDVWIGLRRYWKFLDYVMNTAPWAGLADHREQGFGMTFLGACGLLEPDRKYRRGCLSTLEAIADRFLSRQMGSAEPYRVVVAPYSSYPSPSGHGDGSLVQVIDGSSYARVVQGKADFLNVPSWSYGLGGCHTPPVPGEPPGPCGWFIWFGGFGTTTPSQNTQGDARVYNFTVVDNETVRLEEPYESGGRCPAPAGCVKGWSANTLNGLGQMTYMVGALTTAFDFGRRAFLSANDKRRMDQFGAWENISANWLVTQPYQAVLKGFVSAVGFVGCTPLQADVPAGISAHCYGDVYSARFWTGEISAGLSWQYMYNPTPVVAAVLESIMTGAWAKPGWASPTPGDGRHLLGLDDGGYMVQTDEQGRLATAALNKYLGYFFGFGNAQLYSAVRLGARLPRELPR